MAQSMKQLRILAQPKALYRERYASEQSKKTKQASRFIRAEDNDRALEYPSLVVRRRENYASSTPLMRSGSLALGYICDLNGIKFVLSFYLDTE